MNIENNRLVGVDFKQTPNTSGVQKQILYLVLHDDEGASMAGTTSWILNSASKVSYHVLVGKKGEVVQFVDFNKRAWHCGVSEWKGHKNINDYSIGLSFQNRNKEHYTSQQLEKAIVVAKAICQKYGIKEIIRHKDIAPNRKSDTHALFPFEWFVSQVLGDKYATTNLNLRKGAGVQYGIVFTIKKGTFVKILSTSGDWSQVEVNGVVGFVNNNYLSK